MGRLVDEQEIYAEGGYAQDEEVPAGVEHPRPRRTQHCRRNNGRLLRLKHKKH